MRKCPHCGQDIQDEAVFCRFCRKKVDPPLWLTSLQKCPFCAEWVEVGLETCPLCQKVLPSSGEPVNHSPFTAPTSGTSARDILRSARLKKASKTNDTAIPASGSPDEPEAPSSHEMTENHVSQEFVVPELGLSSFRSRELGKRKRDQPRIDGELLQRKPPVIDPVKVRKPINLTPILSIGLVIILLVAGGIIVIGPGRPFLDAALAGVSPSDPSPTETSIPFPTETAISETPDTSPLITTPTCIPWDQITLADEGEELCVYGNLRRWFEVEDFPFVALFSEASGTFYIVDSVRSHREVQSGTCIMAEGEVEIMRGVRPFIDAAGTLLDCPSEP